MLTHDGLMYMGIEKLTDVVLSVQKDRPELETFLKIFVAGCYDNPRKLVLLIKKEIASLKAATRSYGIYEERQYIIDLRKIQTFIAENASPKFPKEASNLLVKLIDIHKVAYDKFEDSNLFITETFEEFAEDFAAVCKRSNRSVKELIDLIHTRLLDNEHSFYDSLIKHLKDELGEAGLKTLRGKFEDSLTRDNVRFVTFALQEIADARNDVKDYIRACAIGSPVTAGDCLEIARRFVNHSQPDEAFKWLTYKNMDPFFEEASKTLIMLDALKLYGDSAEGHELRIKFFSETLKVSAYNELVRYCRPEHVRECREAAFDIACNFHNVHTALAFFAMAEEFEQMGKFVCQNIHKLNSCGDQMRPAAEKLGAVHPLAGTLLRRRMLEPTLAWARVEGYASAAKDLAACHVLSSKVKNWQNFLSHRVYFGKLTFEHWNKTEFWLKYEEEVEEQLGKQSTMNTMLAE